MRNSIKPNRPTHTFSFPIQQPVISPQSSPRTHLFSYFEILLNTTKLIHLSSTRFQSQWLLTLLANSLPFKSMVSKNGLILESWEKNWKSIPTSLRSQNSPRFVSISILPSSSHSFSIPFDQIANCLHRFDVNITPDVPPILNRYVFSLYSFFYLFFI